MAETLELEPSLVTVEDDLWFNLLIFGDPGVGKTTFASTAQDHPAMKNVLFANIEGGLVSIAHRGDIHKIDIKSTAQLESLAWDLVRGRWPTVHTVVIDNVTELQTLNLQELVQAGIKGGRNMVRNRERTIDDVWQEDYMKSTKQLGRLFRMFRDLPMHVVFTAHMKRVYPKVPDGTDLTKIQPIAQIPSLSAKLGEALMGYVDFVWCLEQDTDRAIDDPARRYAVTVSAGVYRCKTRGPLFQRAIGDVIEAPNLPDIFDTFVEVSTPKPKKKRA
jgi:AAA domain-containing protein